MSSGFGDTVINLPWSPYYCSLIWVDNSPIRLIWAYFNFTHFATKSLYLQLVSTRYKLCTFIKIIQLVLWYSTLGNQNVHSFLCEWYSFLCDSYTHSLYSLFLLPRQAWDLHILKIWIRYIHSNHFNISKNNYTLLEENTKDSFLFEWTVY